MTTTDDFAPRRSWTAPDADTSEPVVLRDRDGARRSGSTWGSGLAWLSARPPQPATQAPVAHAGVGSRLVGPSADGTLQASSAGLDPSPHRPGTDGSAAWPPERRRAVGAVPGPGRSTDRPSERRRSDGDDPDLGGPTEWPAQVRRAAAGGLEAGGVMTWLPDGRWVAGAAADPPGDEMDPSPAARRRGSRRLALARLGARVAGWPRRVAVAVLLVAAVVVGLRPDTAGTAGPPAAPTADVVVAARDLPAGTVFATVDLRTVPLPIPLTPAGAAHRTAGLIGRVAAGPLRGGEVVTDARVVGPGLATGLGPGETAVVPVRIADPETAALVRAGDRIDLLGTPVGADGTPAADVDEAVEVAARLRVLAVLRGVDPADGVVLVVAATQQAARHLAGAAARHRLTVSVRPP